MIVKKRGSRPFNNRIGRSVFKTFVILPYYFLMGLLPLQAQVNVTTYHNDNARTGQNLAETILTPANVNTSQFGELFLQPVDGFIYAQPLYVSDLQIAGVVHNVVFVATENDSVYAFDADSKAGANAHPLWKVSFINPAAGITTVSSTDASCGDLTPQIGITGTPVIDATSHTLYVVAKTKENGVFFQRLHALDITTGAEKFGGPVVIQATAPGTGGGSVSGHVSFDPLLGNQRNGLLLQSGMVYINWSSHCDHGVYHGWVMAYDAQSLQQRGVWPVTANGSLGGIWQGGGGPAADSSGNVFLATGNGTFDLNTGGADAGDTIVKLGLPSGGLLPVVDYFTPYNQSSLSMEDLDLGAGGVLLLPTLPAGAAHQNLLIGAGKQSTVYLVDRSNMGHYNASGDTQIVQSLPGAIGSGLFGTAAFWNNTVYMGGANDVMKAFSFNANNSGLLSPSPISSTTVNFGYPGTSPAVSANGNSNGIVWALQVNAFGSNGPTVLHAYDATNLATELYNSTQNPQDIPGPAVKFTAPIVAGGKVYVPTQTQLAVYGIKGALPAPPTLLSPANGATGVSVTPTLTWSPASGATSYDVYLGTSSPPPMITNTAATSYTPAVLSSGAVYYWMVAAQNSSGPAFSAIWSFSTSSSDAQIVSPVPGSTISGTLADFSWNPIGGATEYLLTVGTTPGAGNIFSGTTTATSQTVGFIPCNGGTVYVQLSAQVNGSFQSGTDSTYPCKSAIGDFNADHFQDLIWQNNSSGQVNVNYYAGAGPQLQSSAVLNNGSNLNGWLVVGAGDFDQNGFQDLVLQNQSTGQVNVNYYGSPGGTTFIGWACLSCSVDVTGWSVVGVADMNGDGVPDLIYQNQSTSQVNVNYFGGSGGATFQGVACLSCGIDVTAWKVKAVADFDGNGVPDLVYQNKSTSQVNVNYYGGSGGATFQGFACLSCGIPVTGWQVVGADDWNADGVPDLVYQNQGSGQVNVDYYGGSGGAVFKGWNCLNCATPLPGWLVRTVAKFGTSGEPDLIWQNTTTNAVSVYYYGLGGGIYQGFACLSCGIDTSAWQVVGTGDFDGNGVPDLVYQNRTTEQVNVDYYGGSGGTTFIGWACLSCGIDVTGWQVKAVADFDGNGVPDLVYQNQSTSQVNVNYYGGSEGSVFQSFACLSCGINVTGWQVKAAADFDGNGVPDLVYQNQSTSQVNVNYYEGTQGDAFKGWACLSCGINVTGWTLVGASDFDGNGVPDLVYQNQTLGRLNVDYYGGSGGSVLKGWNALNNYAGWTVIVPKSR